MGEPTFRCRTGHEPKSGLYYEVLGTPDAGRLPIVFIHGGGATGAAFRRTPDDRPRLGGSARGRGIRVLGHRLAGLRPLGGRNPLELVYADIIEGYDDSSRTSFNGPC